MSRNREPGLKPQKDQVIKNSMINEVCLSIYVDKKNGDLSVRLIDKESLVVIKEIPDQELVDIKDKIEDMTRLLFENG